MEKKNVKGFIGLFLGLASILLIIVSLFCPMEKLTGFGLDGKVSLHSSANVAIAVIAVACAIAAIVFGVMAKKEADKKGPRKSGFIIGIICVILGLIAAGLVAFMSSFTEYINSDGKNGWIAESVKSDKDMKKTMDDLIRGLQKGAGVEETGIPGYTPEENSETE